MKSLRTILFLCICSLLAVKVSATDNSYKLDFDGDGRTDIALYREGSRSLDVAPQPSYWYFLSTRTSITSTFQWGRTLRGNQTNEHFRKIGNDNRCADRGNERQERSSHCRQRTLGQFTVDQSFARTVPARCGRTVQHYVHCRG